MMSPCVADQIFETGESVFSHFLISSSASSAFLMFFELNLLASAKLTTDTVIPPFPDGY